tara:strand:- start:7052 stop:8104 length:1053 start_codon:yes stop_codon:yes gene_type:complete
MDPNANKKGLHNKLNKEQAIARLKAENFKRKTISFYKYVLLSDLEVYRDSLFDAWKKLGVLGRVYIAQEGINAQISVPEYSLKSFRKSVDNYSELKDVSFKIAVQESDFSFYKLTIKVRKQIVADGLTLDQYDVTSVGTHLDAEQWNKAIEEGAIVVDMRNHYESEIGRFENAICPQSETFKEELPEVKDLLKGKEDQKVILYCTGGIRCEKTSAYLKHHGFEDVNQLHGGIIDYVRQLEENEDMVNKFKGKNFVFDERLGERVSKEVISNCHQCGEKADSHINCKNVNCNLLFIQCQSCQSDHQKCCSPECMRLKNLPEDQQKEIRKGKENKERFHSHQKVDLSQAFKK